MRVLHTSDWHLGAVLKQVPRLDFRAGQFVGGCFQQFGG